MEEAKKKNNVWKTLKAEFKKIIWPDKKTVGKETVSVITVSLILGVVIGLLDMVLKYLISFIV
jgi:preprotein translocase subunit SecE